MKVVIVGSQGFIGKELSCVLRAQDIDVIGIDMLASDDPDCIVADIRANTYPYANTRANAGPTDSNAHTNTYAHTRANTYAYPNAYPYAYPYAHASTDAHAHAGAANAYTRPTAIRWANNVYAVW